MPTTAWASPSTVNSSTRERASDQHAGHVVGPVHHHQGMAADHLEATGHPDRGERLLDHVLVEGRPEEGLHRGQGARRRCPPGGRRAAAPAARRRRRPGCGRRSDGRPRPAGWRCRRSRCPGPRPRRPRPPRPARRSRATRVGSVSPMTTRLPALKMPDLSRAMSSRVGPSTSVWSKLTLVSTATSPSTTLVQSHRPPRPTSTTATSTASSANQARAAAVSSSNRVGGSSISGSSRASASSTSSEGVVVDGLAVAGDALVDPAQVGAGVGADRQALGPEQGGGHGRRRSLAVGSGDVDGPGRPPADRPAGGPAPASGRGSGAAASGRHGRLEVDVGVQPGQGLGEIVEGHGRERAARRGGRRAGGAGPPGR